MDVKDWIIAIVAIIGFVATTLTYTFSYLRGYKDGRKYSKNYYRSILGNDIWLWVNGCFYPYEITEEELRDVVVNDRIHGGSLQWP